MQFHILTLFPEMVENGLQTSILGRAIQKGLIGIHAVNIRDYTQDKHNKVDDYPYGGGAGMLMQAQPVYDAWKAVAKPEEGKKPVRVLYMSPQGKTFSQEMARELAQEEELIFLCGHYEGIDERVIEEIVTDPVSIGDYVLTGGELPAMVMIDAISRMVPGVLKNEDSGVTESFQENLLEYPQYTRPEIWEGKKVPDILLSGDHARIDKWRLEKSEERTKILRPDLYEKYDLPGRALEYLLKDKMLHMDMIEDIRRGKADILAVREDGVLTKDRSGGAYRITAKTKDAGERLLSLTDPTGAVYVCHQKFVLMSILERFGLKNFNECYQVIYPKKKAPDLPEPDGAVEIRELDETYAANVEAHYHLYHDEAYIRERIASRQMIGAFLDGELAGFAGVHNDGGMGMLEVLEPFRKRGIGRLLEAEMIRRELAAGHVPYAHVFVENEISVALQKKSGMRFAPGSVFWVS